VDNPEIIGLRVFANGVFPVEISTGKRINSRHRVPLSASVDATTGEVRFYVDQDAIKILAGDAEGH
jgi:hypothetical protein